MLLFFGQQCAQLFQTAEDQSRDRLATPRVDGFRVGVIVPSRRNGSMPRRWRLTIAVGSS